MTDTVKTRVAFHVQEGELIPESVKIRGNVIIAEILMPQVDEAGERMAPVEVGGLWADPKIGKAVFRDKQIKLTRTEMRLLLVLMDAYPSGATNEEIRLALGYNGGSTVSIKDKVGRLRLALKGVAKVPAIWGVGYMLVPPEDS